VGENFRALSEPNGALLYLDLLKRSLLGVTQEDNSLRVCEEGSRVVVRGVPYAKKLRLTGRDWPEKALTMIGQSRLDNLQWCIRQALEDQVPGDLIETGVWRGGAVIFMRGMLRVYGSPRLVWAADSFRGFPTSMASLDPKGPSPAWMRNVLAVPLTEVKRNFRRYGLLDKQVRFLEGWFRNTLPKAAIKKLSVLRLDGDYYVSTMDALTHLYSRVSPGGFVIVDDYNIPACKQAVHDFRNTQGIAEKIVGIDGLGVFWRKT
jgi:hypothetical protein